MSNHILLQPVSDVVKFRNQDFEKIRSYCSRVDILWEDPKFTPNIGNLIWKRPWQIVSSPCLFLEGATSHDIRQGILDDGYLAVAMQALSARPQLLRWVVPEDQQCSADNSGVAHFRIWQLGTWYDICVDNRLPTKGGKLVYTHSNNTNEFWCALLEKAYAKLYGSYKVVERGRNADAMVDFSGGISERIFLNNPPSGFGNMLVKAYEKNLLMCAAISEEDIYLDDSLRGSSRCPVKILKDVQNYAVTSVQYNETSNKVLVRLKYPKDSHESTGPSSEPASKLRSTLVVISDPGLTVDNDGEFWMSERDFKEHFTTLSICHLSPDTIMNSDERFGTSKNWWVNSFKGEWVIGVSAGGKEFDNIHRNYQYRITLADPDDGDKDGLCSVVISLMQKNKTRQLEWNLGFYMFKLENPNSLPSPLGYEFFASNPHNYGLRLQVNIREVVYRQKLVPGVYCIIPCTKYRNREGEFMLRVFTGEKVTMTESDRSSRVVDAPDITADLVVNRMIPVAEETKTDEDVVKLFCEVSGKDLTIDWEGLKVILETQSASDIANVFLLADIFKFALEKISSVINYVFSTAIDFQTPKPGQMTISKELCRSLISFTDEKNLGKIGFDEFDTLWSQICRWKLIFRLHSKRKKGYIEAVKLSNALEHAGFILNKEVLGILIHRYGDEQGSLSLDDFIMCIVALHLEFMNFKNSDKDKTGQVAVSLNEWVGKSFFS